ncbi:ParB/RepB/Spo0J family partition protein [Pyxidicoccus sp. MSG2]|uniref:ParB/RepB/Spo0J family partition protein n=1 Tax=Pyxidicoccus sp. MSG2 TaxID=2996790 RepID=UPI00226FF892|nr:ParB N-terminal domain-containing protein [Pyxidicoccus sp. MSG2]MCY1021996.1 ParB N-terminal domain-containing protein [Pyxidicoccus sp. MSG2]
MDAEHRVDGQEGMPGTSPAEGQSRSEEGGHAEGAPGEHRAEGMPHGEHRAEGGPPGEPPHGEHRAEAGSSGESPPGEQRAEGDQPQGGEQHGGGSSSGEQRAEGGEPSQDASREASPGGEPGAEAQGGSEQREESQVAMEDESEQETDEGGLPEGLAAPEERLAGRVTLVLMPLEKLQDDNMFRLRPEGDVSGLATDIARLGQLFPVDVRPSGEDGYQLVCGFRRVAALRFLKRDAVQARVHMGLSDEDALLMSLADAIHATPVEPEVLEAKREQLESQGRLSAAVRDMLEKALATEDSLAPEGVEEEIDADELASDVSERLGAINQDLSLLADVFAALDDSRKAELLMQLRYSSQLVAYLEGL